MDTNPLALPEPLALRELIPAEFTNLLQQTMESIRTKTYRDGKTYVAVGSQHGGRLMLQINIHANEILKLVRSSSIDKRSNDPSSGKNRPIDEKHVKNIKNYISERSKSGNKWIIGPITANVSPEKIQYQKVWEDFYIVFIPDHTFLEITDGQHRATAIIRLIEELQSEEQKLILNSSFSFNIVLEASLEQCQTDFRDMAQTQPIAQSLLVSYASFGRDAVAKEVVERVDLFRDKTEKIKKSPGSRTNFIYTLNYVAKLVSCAFAGKSDQKLSEYNSTEIVEEKATLLSDCLNYFFSKVPATLAEVKKEKFSWKDAQEFRNSNILGISVGLEILGTLLYETYNQEMNSFNLDMVDQIVDKIDWSKDGECWNNTIIIGNVKEKDTSDPEKNSLEDKPDEGEDSLDDEKVRNSKKRIFANRASVARALNRCREKLGWKIP